MVATEILDHYRGGQEEHRLAHAAGRLERIRTSEILDRHLPAPPSRILDLGGGTGVYALPLAAHGYHVHLVDAVPVHVERARVLSSTASLPLASADVGDARRLAFPDAMFDAVLLLGPLYHLIERTDRIAALAEVRRVLVPNGVLLSAYISRFASAFDGIRDNALRDPEFFAIVDRDLTDGTHLNLTTRPDWFTTVYFHRPEEIQPEIEAAGLRFQGAVAVEGPGWFSQDLDAWLDDDAARERLLNVLRRIEAEPSVLGSSAHLLSVSWK